MPIEKKRIESIVTEALAESQVFLVEVAVSRSNVIQVYVDHPAGVSLDDCVSIHRAIEEHLDRDQEDYELQVSSPGLGQPIRVIQQYLKAVGEKLEVATTDGELLKGTLLEVVPANGDQPAALTLKLTGTKRKPAPEEPVVLTIDRIKSARVEIDFKQL